MFEPRLALASLSGEADADWALAAADLAGAAFLGGISLDEPARNAAQKLVDRDRREFLPADPLRFIDEHLTQITAAKNESKAPPIRPAINVRSTTVEPIRRAASICATHDAIFELNAHCRQPELCSVGCGETLLADSTRLAEFVSAAANEEPAVCVKVRAEVDDVDLAVVATEIEAAGADAIHVDAMDSASVIEKLTTATDLFVIANNGVRDYQTVKTYLDYGADAVSVGRPSREPNGPVMRRVANAVSGISVEEPRQ